MIKLEIIGNLGADAEVKVYNGNKFVTFRVAHTDKWGLVSFNNFYYCRYFYNVVVVLLG